jgi:hypothetical protein
MLNHQLEVYAMPGIGVPMIKESWISYYYSLIQKHSTSCDYQDAADACKCLTGYVLHYSSTRRIKFTMCHISPMYSEFSCSVETSHRRIQTWAILRQTMKATSRNTVEDFYHDRMLYLGFLQMYILSPFQLSVRWVPVSVDKILFCCGTSVTTYLQVASTDYGTPVKPTNLGSDPVCWWMMTKKKKKKKKNLTRIHAVTEQDQD